MPRFRLRYQATDLELPPGDFVVGRSSSCHLSLDDALVSRRHAVLHVTEDEVTVEDLESRNGVTVNGARIAEPTAMRHLDRLGIGSQEMVLLEIGRRKSDPAGDNLHCFVCGHRMETGQTYCRRCGAPARRNARTLAGQTLEVTVPFPPADQEQTRNRTGMGLLAGIVDKAFAMGRFEEAERILAKHLESLLERAEEGRTISEQSVRDATAYALRLAEGLARPPWIDWVFRMHAATGLLMTTADVDSLHEIIRRIGYRDARALRQYLRVIGNERSKLSASERFVVQRLAGLEKVVTA